MRKSLLALLPAGVALVVTGCFPEMWGEPQPMHPSAAQLASTFFVTIEDRRIEPQAETYVYRTTDYDLSLRLLPNSVEFTLVNLSREVLRLVWDETAMVMPDGHASRVVPPGTAYTAVNQPVAAAIVPPMAKMTSAFIPVANIYWNPNTESYAQKPLFNLPIREETNLRVSIGFELGDQRQRLEILITGLPRT
jgi:hypothetical protein